MHRFFSVFLAVPLLWVSTSLAFDLSHAGFSEVLAEVNRKGLIHYEALKKNPAALHAYMKTLSEVAPTEMDGWPESDQIAFWINAYNAFTLKAIIDHHPIQASFIKSRRYPKNSIRQISGVWTDLTFPVAGKNLTLDHIEHRILRREFNEPRIHMALVCAALGCPPLREEAFVGEKLDDQLEDQTKTFLSDPEKFRIEADRGIVWLSAIFDWFRRDFVSTDGAGALFQDHRKTNRAVLNFIHRSVSPEKKKLLELSNLRIKYLKYDWTLNEQE